MGKFVRVEVVLIPFPFSNLKRNKIRPALILARAEFDNLILCQITSKPYSSKMAIELKNSDFDNGGLPITSYIRPDKVFTAEPSIIIRSAGKLNSNKKNEVLTKVRKMFS